MSLSNKLTFSLASLVAMFAIGCLFMVIPAEAGDPNDDDATHTDHTHRAKPTVKSIELVSVMTKGTGNRTTGNDTVSGDTVLLVDDVDDATNITLIAVTEAATTTNGQFQLEVTFSEAVYSHDDFDDVFAIVPNDADLDADEVTITAAARSAPTTNLAAVTVIEAIRKQTGVNANNDAVYSPTTFLLTIQVTPALYTHLRHADKPIIDVWVKVNADAVASPSTGPVLKDGVFSTTHGDTNVESSLEKFSVVAAFDTTAPTLTAGAAPTKPGTDGNLTFTFTAADEGGSGLGADLTTDSITVVGGTIVSLTKDGMVYTLVVDPTDEYTDVRVTVAASGVKDRAANPIASDVTAMYDAPARPVDGVIEIPANSRIIVVRDDDHTKTGASGLNFHANVMTAEWAAMPDLWALFNKTAAAIPRGGDGGGALIIKEYMPPTADADKLAVGSVGISEIMWSLDTGYYGSVGKEDIASQWIELHNVNDKPVKVQLSTLTGEATLDGANGLRGDLAKPTLDAVTNYFNGIPGEKAWDVPGANGSSLLSGLNFTAMARKSPDADKKVYFSATNNYTKRDGRKSGSWQKATVEYLTKRTTQTDVADIVYKYIGTPGLQNDYKPAGQTIFIKARTKPSGAGFIINEVGNMLDDKYDWIELRNNTGGNVNVRNYMISIITSNTSDDPLIEFEANDNFEIAKGGVFLILASDPAEDPNHPIAPGYDIDKPAEAQQPGITMANTPVRYKAVNFTLPNDGMFVLMVRKPDNHEGQRSGGHKDKGVAETGNNDLDKVIDIAGYDDNLAFGGYPNIVSNTGLWPLYKFDGPLSANKLAGGKVYKRNRVTTPNDRWGVGAHENKNDAGNAAFGAVDNQGNIGYRRAFTGDGTPGYNNTEYKTRGTDAAMPVYISEIMYAHTGAANSPPQWLELYNPSKAVGIGLGDFRLTITNHADTMVDGAVVKDGWKGKDTASVMLSGMSLPPNQTVLITSTNAIRKNVFIPENRIFKISPRHSAAFGLTNRRAAVINVYGFEIILEVKTSDGKGWVEVDKIGNLADKRTADQLDRGQDATKLRRFDAPRWMWPSGFDTEDDRVRVSVARRRGITSGPLDGTWPKYSADAKKSPWILTIDDPRYFSTEPTYYGHSSDISTPGQTWGQPLPVQLSFFRPTLENGEVVIRWTTESELDNAGFNILRSETREGEYKQVNTELIQGNGTTGERSNYKWVDTTAKPGVVYYYQIEDVSFAGERQTLTVTKLKGLISAKNKLTTKWGELKEVQ